MSAVGWHPLGTVSGLELAEAKLQAHWAAQIVAAFGHTLLDPRSDDSQSNLGWEEQVQALCSHPSPEGFRVGLQISCLRLIFLDARYRCVSAFELEGQTVQDGLAWLGSTYAEKSDASSPRLFSLRDYEMPDHPVANQGAFELNNPAAFQELHHWYANAHGVIHSMTQVWQQATAVRCWPHYFDIASLLTFDQKQDNQPRPTIGCGMSPGDNTYSEPYWYITAWPYPSNEQLPELSVGSWHTEGFVGAILTAQALFESSSVETQQQCVKKFFSDGTQASFSALDVTPGTL